MIRDTDIELIELRAQLAQIEAMIKIYEQALMVVVDVDRIAKIRGTIAELEFKKEVIERKIEELQRTEQYHEETEGVESGGVVTEIEQIYVDRGETHERPGGEEAREPSDEEASLSGRPVYPEEVPFPERMGFMPLLEEWCSKMKEEHGKIFEDKIVVFIQHLLRDFQNMLNCYFELGLSEENTYIIGIPYSTKEHVVKNLKIKGYENIWNPSEYPFDNIVEEVMNKAFEDARKNGNKLLIVEDGGYAVPYIHRKSTFDANIILGAVEQTANGIWMDIEAIAENSTSKSYEEQKAELSKNLKIPLIDVAESESKKKIEASFVGEAVISNIKALLQKSGMSINGKNALVVGYGSVGYEIARQLRLQPLPVVSVYDKDPISLVKARSIGFRTSENISELIQDSDIIIGATGHKNVIGRQEFEIMKNGTYLVSATSKRREFNWDELKNLTLKEEKTHFGKKNYLRNSNILYIVAGGYPINFYASESIPERNIQFVPTLLLDASVFLITNALKSGLYEYNIENEINGRLREREESIIKRYGTYIK